MSRRHRANPLSSLRAEKTFCSPVLFSGVAALILSRTEKDSLVSYVKTTTQNLLKLHPKTPEAFVFLISGSLPGEAILHLRQLSLFLMVCHLPDNILHSVAYQELLSPRSDKTWFGQLEHVCHQYALPHPLQLLKNPPEKENFKKLVKLKVADFWKQKYIAYIKDMNLSSLLYFKPEYCSLLHPHPILTTAGHSYDVNKMIVQLRLLSGRARLGSLLRHFSPGNSGHCELCREEVEDLTHLLAPRCPKLANRALTLKEFMKKSLSCSERCTLLLQEIMIESKDDPQLWIQFVLDCSVLPNVIAASQWDTAVMGKMFSATRTYCYGLHRTRLQLLGRWNTV